MSSNDALKYIILNALDRNVSRIAKDAGVPRTTTTYILNKLRKWKIARRVYHEKRDHWMYNLR